MKEGVDSSLFVIYADNADQRTHTYFHSRLTYSVYRAIRFRNEWQVRRLNLLGQIYEAAVGLPLYQIEEIKNADIVHLHWVNDGGLSYRTLKELLQNKCVVWTLHDMYPFTAGCYHSEGCLQFEAHCEHCPYARSGSAEQFVGKLFRKKADAMKGAVNIAFAGCSQWITSLARSSSLLQGKKVLNIPNTLDTDLFHPGADKIMLPVSTAEKKTVMFGAASANPKKGFDLLIQCLMELPKEEYRLLVFGGFHEDERLKDYETIYTGHISDPEILASYYAQADVFVSPSMEDNLSNVVMESMSCGTPAVVFDIGGMRDMVEHGVNGYVAVPFDIHDLAAGIKTVCSHAEEYGVNARQTVLERFLSDKVSDHYIRLYNDLLKQNDV